MTGEGDSNLPPGTGDRYPPLLTVSHRHGSYGRTTRGPALTLRGVLEQVARLHPQNSTQCVEGDAVHTLDVVATTTPADLLGGVRRIGDLLAATPVYPAQLRRRPPERQRPAITEVTAGRRVRMNWPG